MSSTETSMAAPSGNIYNGKIVVDPLTRIEGHLRIEVEVENGKVKDARSTATLFRGLEIILRGRDPRDAQHFAQRACGVCTFTHALSSIRAVDDAVGVVIPKNANYIRNLVLGAHFLHDHIVHFYGLHALDFVDVTSALQADPYAAAKLASNISPRQTKGEDLKAVQDKLKSFVASGQLGPFANAYFLGGHPAFRLTPELNLIATAHYLEALRVQVKIAKAVACFGAKNPHPQFTVVGGVSCYQSLTKARMDEYRSLVKDAIAFVNEVYIPDLLAIGGVYKDECGAYGGTHNFLAFGEFPEYGKTDLNKRFLKPGVAFNRDFAKMEDMDPKAIKEHVRYSWFVGEEAHHPYEGVTEPKFTGLDNSDRYSWSKAPRYKDEPMETGPLAEVLISYYKGVEPVKQTVDAVLQKLSIGPEMLFSTLGRTAARGIETAVIAGQLENWLGEFEANVASGDDVIVAEHEMPYSAEGVGFVNAPRGGLSHWIRIEKGKIANYQLVVPSTWNLGPRCANGKLSPVEESLVGTPITDASRPVELLRTVHSFDPCMACAVHVIDPASNEERVFKIL